MAEILSLDPTRTGRGRKRTADEALEENKGTFADLVLIGFDHNGQIVVGSTEGPGDTLWLIEVGKTHLLNGCPGQE